MSKKEKDDALTGYIKMTNDMQREISDLRGQLYRAKEDAAQEKKLRELANEHYRQAEQERDEANERLISRCERSKMTDVELQVVTCVALSGSPMGRGAVFTSWGDVMGLRGEPSSEVDGDLRRRARESLEIELVARGLIAPRQKKKEA